MHVNDAIGPVHNSHIRTVRRCKKQFEYNYIENIQPKRPALPLARGIWLHYCLEAQFLRWGIEDGTLLRCPDFIFVEGVGDVNVVVDSSTKEAYLTLGEADKEEFYSYKLSAAGMLELLIELVWNRLFDAEKEKYTEDDHTLPEAVKRILEEYFYHWKDEERPDILLVEVEWVREYKGVEFEGRIDYVVRDPRGLIVIGDWKSSKYTPHAEWKFMESQLNLYPWGVAPQLLELGLDKDEIENAAVEFDYLQTKLPTTPSQNKDGSISKRKIKTSYLTLTRALKEYGKKWTDRQIQDYLAKNEGEFFIRQRLPRNRKVVKTLVDELVADAAVIGTIIEDPSFITRTVTKQCDWDCDFMALCKGELYGQDVSHIRKTEYEPRVNTRGLAGGVEDED